MLLGLPAGRSFGPTPGPKYIRFDKGRMPLKKRGLGLAPVGYGPPAKNLPTQGELMWTWIKKHKGITILACVALIGAGGFLYVRQQAEEAMASLAQLSEETAFVERRSIESSVSSTGLIISDNTRSLSSTLTGLEVLTVHVEVGDVVAVGDPLFTFDTADLQESLSEAEDVLSAQEVASGITLDNAKRNLAMAVETQNYQVEAAARGVLNAHNALMAASEAYDTLQDKLSAADSGISAAQQAADAAQQNFNALQAGNTALATATQAAAEAEAAYKIAAASLTNAQNTFDVAKAALDAADASASEYSNLQAAVTAAQTALDTAQAAEAAAKATLTEKQAALAEEQLKVQGGDAAKVLSAAQSGLASARSARDTLEGSLTTAENSLRQARIAYENAVSTYDYTVASQLSQYEGSEDALKGAKAQAGVSTITYENNVESVEKQLEKGVVTANIPGTVTAVNVKEGDRYMGGEIAAIQDTSALVVSAEIDEYDIADIAIGMKAVFKTDATRDEQLQGQVIFISPTPTPGSDVTYQVKVAITSDTTRLRLGMNAKLNIILSETGDVLTVPYDAVQQDEAGRDIIYSVERGADGAVTKTAIPVTVGVEGDYYVEVSGDIAEGMEVSLPSDEVDFMARMEEMRENMMG